MKRIRAPVQKFQKFQKLEKDEIAFFLSKIPEKDRAEALDVVQRDYTELLFDPQIHPIEIGRDMHLRFVPDSVRIRGEYVEKEYSHKERKAAKSKNRQALKHMGYSLEDYFETPAVREWCKLLQQEISNQGKRLKEKQDKLLRRSKRLKKK